jgi:hypothetical protein
MRRLTGIKRRKQRQQKRSCHCTTKGWPRKGQHDATCGLNKYAQTAKRLGISRLHAIVEMDGM